MGESPPDPAALITQLESPQYDLRMSATEALVELGVSGIAPLRGAFETGSSEFKTRAIYILQEISLAGNMAAEEAAAKALGQIANSNSVGSGRAKAVLAQLDAIRANRALEKLISLGAKFDRLAEPAFTSEQALIIDSKQWRGTDDDLDLVLRLDGVEAIQLSGASVTDNWVAKTSQIPTLTHVVIKRAGKISNSALKSVAQIPRLQRLDVFYSPINDDCIANFKVMKDHLTHVRLYGTGVTMDGAQELQAMLAENTVLDFKRGAFLGVHCRTDVSMLCQVMSVTEGSGAHRAGILTGDILIQYGDKPVKSFDQLRESIAVNVAGDKTKVRLLRKATEVVFYLSPPKTAEELKATVKPHQLGLMVTKVEKGGPFEQAGIQSGDLLYSTGGIRPSSLKEMLVTLKKAADGGVPAVPGRPQAQPGRVIDPTGITALRGFREMEVDVMFGEWE